MLRKWNSSFLLSVALVFVACTFSSRADSQTISTPSRTFTLENTIHVPPVPAGSRELRLWIPVPYEESSQAVGKVKITGVPRWKVLAEPEYRNRFVYVVIDRAALANGAEIKASFHVQRFEHQVVLNGNDDEQGTPTVATARFLKPDRLVPLDGEIADLSEKEAGGAMLPLDKSRRLYEYVIATMHYDHDGSDWGRGDALWACNSKHGNCTDFHSLFIALARAAGIPARFEIGFSIPTNAHEGAITSYHCWAQFYVAGTGWVPLDASEAWKHKELHDYYFGGLDANRVKMSMGRDIRLNPPQKGGPLNYFVYPYAELDGKPYTAITNEYSFKDDLNSGPVAPSIMNGK
jgi:transglutaminase-like putative cysteine protease